MPTASRIKHIRKPLSPDWNGIRKNISLKRAALKDAQFCMKHTGIAAFSTFLVTLITAEKRRIEQANAMGAKAGAVRSDPVAQGGS